eukprot:8107439-Alexandrium_andersonii.AAC.1
MGVYSLGVGAAKRRVASIPQGCPFSMLFLGFLKAAWISAVREVEPSAVPRSLADDAMALTAQADGETCEQHAARHAAV